MTHWILGVTGDKDDAAEFRGRATAAMEKHVRDGATYSAGTKDEPESRAIPRFFQWLRDCLAWQVSVMFVFAIATTTATRLRAPFWIELSTLILLLISLAFIALTTASTLQRVLDLKRIALDWVQFERPGCAADIVLVDELFTYSRDELEMLKLWLRSRGIDLASRFSAIRTGLLAAFAVVATLSAGHIVSSASSYLQVLSGVAHALPPVAPSWWLLIGAGVLGFSLAVTAWREAPQDALRTQLALVNFVIARRRLEGAHRHDGE